MVISNASIKIQTRGRSDIIDITQKVKEKVEESGIREGGVILFIPGSTAALTTIEYERGVINDLRRAIERLAPEGIPYEHDACWGDGNGYAHVRAALLGPSLAIPIRGGRLVLGTWQQIILIDFDNRPRRREIITQIVGE